MPRMARNILRMKMVSMRETATRYALSLFRTYIYRLGGHWHEAQPLFKMVWRGE